MKRLLSMLPMVLLAVCAISLGSCGGDDNPGNGPSNGNPLVGRWVRSPSNVSWSALITTPCPHCGFNDQPYYTTTAPEVATDRNECDDIYIFNSDGTYSRRWKMGHIEWLFDDDYNPIGCEHWMDFSESGMWNYDPATRMLSLSNSQSYIITNISESMWTGMDTDNANTYTYTAM